MFAIYFPLLQHHKPGTVLTTILSSANFVKFGVASASPLENLPCFTLDDSPSTRVSTPRAVIVTVSCIYIISILSCSGGPAYYLRNDFGGPSYWFVIICQAIHWEICRVSACHYIKGGLSVLFEGVTP